MNITTELNKIRDALKSSTAIVAWSVTNFSKTHTVYKGIDTRKSPAESECPVVYIYPVQQMGGYDLDDQDIGIGAICIISKDTITTTTTAVNGETVTLNEYAGIDLVEALRELVEQEIVGIALSNGDLVVEVNVDYEPIDAFPYFIATMDAMIRHEYSQGDDPYS